MNNTKKDSLGDRMKEYEAVSNIKMTRRTPVIIRVDGKAFHTFTKGFKKPFDRVMMESMQETTKYLCENIQGAVLGYTQSDEITIVVVDYQNINTSAWFDNKVQKMCSVAASMATMQFNKVFAAKVGEKVGKEDITAYEKAMKRGGMFDARCFNIPKDEVTNCLIWRQQDAVRNSIEGLGRAYFSHNELFKKCGEDIKTMLKEQKDVKWWELPITCQRGSCIIKEVNEETGRSGWIVDNNIPIFTENRDYVEKLINFEDGDTQR